MKWNETEFLNTSKIPVIKVRGVNEYVLGLPQGTDFLLEGTEFSKHAKDFLLTKNNSSLEQAVLAMIDIVLPNNSEIKDSFYTKCKNKAMLKGPILDHIMVYAACMDKGFHDCITSSPNVIMSNLSIRNIQIDAEYDKSIKDYLDTRNFITQYVIPYSFSMVGDFLSIARCHDEKKVILSNQSMYYHDFYKIFRLVVEAFEKDALDLCLMTLDQDRAFTDSTLERDKLVGVVEPSPNRDFIFKAVDVHKDSWSKLKNYITIVTIFSFLNPLLSLAGLLSSLSKRKKRSTHSDQPLSDTEESQQGDTNE